MKSGKGKGLLMVLALVIALLPAAGSIEVSASDTNGLSGIAKVLANATPSKDDSGIKSNAGIAGIIANETATHKVSIRLAEKILKEPKIDIEELIVNARCKAWENKAIVTVDETEFVYVREEPSTEGSIIGIMPHGAAGDVIEQSGDWSYISSGTVEGYVNNNYLAFGKKALQVAEETCGYVACVTSYEANVRKSPSMDAEVIDTVSEGKYFEVLEDDVNWVRLRYSKDQEAYMSKEVVDVFLATGVAVRLVDESEEEPEESVDDASETNNAAYEDTAQQQDDSSKVYEEPVSYEEPAVEAAAYEPEPEASSGSGESVFKVTAYCPCSICCGSFSNGQTASGSVGTPGRTIAVDSSIIPLGTTVYIDGVPYVAEDTGVSGYSIDIFMSTHVEALNWGVRYCTVTW